MEYKFTRESGQYYMDRGGNMCINEACQCSDLSIECIPGSTESTTKERCECNRCGTKWIADLSPTKIQKVSVREGEWKEVEFPGEIGRDIFSATYDSSEDLREAIVSFLESWKLVDPQRKGEGLAALANLARMKL